MQALLIVALRSKRDVLVARQRARQIAALLHFPFQAQACISAGTFALAAQALRQSRGYEICIHVEDKALHIFPRARGGEGALNSANHQPDVPSPDGLLRLVKPLPGSGAEFSSEDLAWMLKQLNDQAGFSLFEEIQHQNQEMLALLHELQSVQSEVPQPPEKQATTSAA